MAVEWIAELGSNHKGDPSLAYRMVKEAAKAGATIVKFQAGRSPTDPIRYADPFLKVAAGWCEDFGVEFLASIWSWKGLQLCQAIGMKRRKIAHQQANVNYLGTSTMLNESLPTFISIDTSSQDNMQFYNTKWRDKKITWLFVSSEYPSYSYPKWKDYSHGSGYSDHTHGIAAPLCAVAHGAKVIECHFTLDPTESSIKDNHFACTPDEFATMVQLGNEIAGLGT